MDEVWKNKAPTMPYHPYESAQARFWADYIHNNIPNFFGFFCSHFHSILVASLQNFEIDVHVIFPIILSQLCVRKFEIEFHPLLFNF